MFELYRISNPTMEETGTTNPKYQPLQVAWHPFVRPRLKNHPLSIHSSVTRQIVPLMCEELLTQSSSKSVLPAIKNSYMAVIFFFLLFHRTLSWACMNPGIYLKHSFSTYTCLCNSSLLCNQVCINTSPMYALPDKQLSA